ncbi:transglycosylase SLT domain-containing protein [Candidatus Falkowbacteria bacterium]|nr:transglycosylase SLT domain-containing protein [Candidatus Falkowbacteria bacterium]
MNALILLVAAGLSFIGNYENIEAKVMTLQKVEQPAREIPVKEIQALKRRVINKYSRMGYPYTQIARVARKLTHGNVNGLLTNWYSLPANFRAKMIYLFQAYGLEDMLFLMLYESAGQTNLVSSSGARGLFQIMPGTANELCGIDEQQLDILFDPETNAACAAQILLKKGAIENWRVGVIRYNGQFLRCNIRGYFQCLARTINGKDKKAAAVAQGSLDYFLNFLIYKEVGQAFILGYES